MSDSAQRCSALTSAVVLFMLAGTASAQLEQPFPAVFQLSSLLPGNGGDGSLGAVLNGVAAGDRAGKFVSSAGDVNGDGIDDLIVSATEADPGGLQSAGSVYVVFGRDAGQGQDFGPTFELSSLDGTNGFRMDGLDTSLRIGQAIASAGDINHDGVDDIVIGARGASHDGMTNAGSAWVVFGRNVGNGSTFPVSFDLGTLDGTNGFRFDGAAAHDQCGYAVGGVGDIDGDGIDDLAIAAYRAEVGSSDRGACYVIFGRDSGVEFPALMEANDIDGSTGFSIVGGASNTTLGTAVSTAGDINGDGINDVLLCDYGGTSSSMAVVVYGKDTSAVGNFPASLSVDALDGSNGFIMETGGPYQAESVASVGDVSGDGIDDIVIGGSYYGWGAVSYSGEATVVYGRDELAGDIFPAAINLNSLPRVRGFKFVGSESYERVGHRVAGAGDVNGDGINDILVSSFTATSYYDFHSTPGRDYVIFGRGPATPFYSVVKAADLVGADGMRLEGVNAGDLAGYWGVAACDLNHDGANDLIFGAYGGDPDGHVDAGQTYVVYGRHIPITCPPDLNHDGTLDFFDVQAFLNYFSVQDPIADFTNDGVFDFFDIQAFLNAFSDGCP